MAKKVTAQHIETTEKRLNLWLRGIYEDCPIEIIDVSVTGHKNSITQRKISLLVNQLLNTHGNRFKIGKTCQADRRINQKDYRYTYTKMYLLYKSQSPAYVSHYENLYITKHFENEKNDNETKISVGRPCSFANSYYVYLVVN
ncbi:MAG: hypothetical protein JNL70_00960 [Saprospiraceae bacterium]|nr:hypothetical protein [Saprospiraceae bacterium]